jgi:long-chain fatty acid transport protein
MIDLRRRAGLINPFSGLLVDVADVQLESDFDTGVGFNLGVLHKVNDLFHWGFSYRSKLTIEYGGTGRLEQVLTGNPALDGQVAATLPLGQDLPIETQIQFPDSASLGLGFNISDRSFFEIDFNWTGWDSFDSVPLTFIDNPALSTNIDTKWEDAIHVRTGLRWKQDDTSEWRFGLYYDETPQPDDSVGPLLPDANRIGYTVGWGHEYNSFNMDLALLLVDFADRTTLTNDDGFNGSYKTNITLFGVSFGF